MSNREDRETALVVEAIRATRPDVPVDQIIRDVFTKVNRRYPEDSATPSTEVEDDDAISGMTELVRSFGGQHFYVRIRAGVMYITLDPSALIAPDTLPQQYSGYPVVLVPKPLKDLVQEGT